MLWACDDRKKNVFLRSANGSGNGIGGTWISTSIWTRCGSCWNNKNKRGKMNLWWLVLAGKISANVVSVILITHPYIHTSVYTRTRRRIVRAFWKSKRLEGSTFFHFLEGSTQGVPPPLTLIWSRNCCDHFPFMLLKRIKRKVNSNCYEIWHIETSNFHFAVLSKNYDMKILIISCICDF